MSKVLVALLLFPCLLFAQLSIRDIQYTEEASGASPYAGQTVTVTGIVTSEAFRDNGMFISDPGGGIWSGVYVYDPPLSPARGDCVRITATVFEFYGLTELASVTALENLGPGTLPEPVETTYNRLFNDGEQFEGVLTSIPEPCRITAVGADYTVFGQIGVLGGGLSGVMILNNNLSYMPEVDDSIGYLIGCGYSHELPGYMLAIRDDADLGYVDSFPPELECVQAVTINELNINFNERLSTDGLSSPDNYTITNLSHPEYPELTVLAANLFSDRKILHLTLLEDLNESDSYSLTVDAVSDLAGNVLSDITTSFAGFQEPQITPITSIYDSFEVYSGARVLLRGVINCVEDVTTSSGSHRLNFYLQDESGRGIAFDVAANAHDFPAIQRHNRILIQGEVNAYGGIVQIGDFQNEDITLINEGVPLSVPVQIATGDRIAQAAIIGTATANLYAAGTWCTVTGTIYQVDEHVGDGTNIYIDDGSGSLVVRVWDNFEIDSVNIDGIYYHLGSELVGVACRITGPANAYDGDFLMLAGYMEDIIGLPVARIPHTARPDRCSLSQNYPNPFNPSTTFEYFLPAAADISIQVYDVLGREVQTLITGMTPAGVHSVTWDGSHAASGVYLVVLEAPQVRSVRKAILLR